MPRQRQEMLQGKLAEVVLPLLAIQTINATERKLVSQPGSITIHLRVALGSVLADVRLVGIVERNHCGGLLKLARCWSPSSMSSRIPSGLGACWRWWLANSDC